MTRELTIDLEETAKRSRQVGDITVAAYDASLGYGPTRRWEPRSATTRKRTPQCQAAGTYSQCENTGKPETVARVDGFSADWHEGESGWYSVPADTEGAVTLHFCGIHSPARKTAKIMAQNTERDFNYRHAEWSRKLQGLTQARDGRVHRAEAKVLAAARIPSLVTPNDEAAETLLDAAAFLRAEIVAADQELATKRAVLLSEEPTR